MTQPEQKQPFQRQTPAHPDLGDRDRWGRVTWEEAVQKRTAACPDSFKIFPQGQAPQPGDIKGCREEGSLRLLRVSWPWTA